MIEKTFNNIIKEPKFKLFVYGILKNRFVGKSATITAKCYHLRAYPAITEVGSGWKVSGKIIEVDAKTLAELDMIEGYPTLYHRQLHKVDGEYVQIYVYTDGKSIQHKPKCSNFKDRTLTFSQNLSDKENIQLPRIRGGEARGNTMLDYFDTPDSLSWEKVYDECFYMGEEEALAYLAELASTVSDNPDYCDAWAAETYSDFVDGYEEERYQHYVESFHEG